MPSKHDHAPLTEAQPSLSLVKHTFETGNVPYCCELDCLLVDSPLICPLLEWKACLRINVISFLDDDLINPPSSITWQETVLASSGPSTCMVSKENLLVNHPSSSFTDRVGKIKREYYIRLDPRIGQSSMHLRKYQLYWENSSREHLTT